MATAAQILKLRRKLQDYYSKRTGAVLSSSEYAFTDVELTDLIDDAFAEVSDGEADADTGTALHEAMAMIVSRVDGLLMIAQDEARRLKWQTNNEINDPTAIADNLVKVAKQLQDRYEQYKKRKLQEELAGITGRPTGGVLTFNSTVPLHLNRNFDNATVRRNKSPDHY